MERIMIVPKTWLAIIVLWCLALNCYTQLNAQTIHYENHLIERVDIEIQNLPAGANFDTHAVQMRMTTRAGNMFSHADFDNDLKNLAKEFDRVIPKIEERNNKLLITLKIWPKPIIRSISWHGNGKRVSCDRLKKELDIPLCSVFDRQGFNKAFHKLKTYYVKKGFFEAELDYCVKRDDCTNEVDIEITIQEGRAGKIDDIVFCGFTDSEESELIDMIVTKKYFFLTSWYTNEGNYNEDMVQHDQFTILNFLQNEGYADAQVDIEVQESKKCDRITLLIKAEHGVKYCLGPITFEGNCIFTDEEIRSQICLCEGDAFSPDKIRETQRKLMNFYGKRGYIDALIDYDPQLDCENKLYSVKFVIDEGLEYRVGLIKVFGNCTTQSRVILHETLLVPGEIFNIERLQLTEKRLMNVGYFKCVNVYAVKSEGPYSLGPNYRDVHIEVEEANTGYFSTSLGFSSNESLFGGVTITEKNFNYKALGRCWKDGFRCLRGGGEYLSANATIGSKSRKYSLSWTKPYFYDTPWIVGFDLERSSNRYISHNYDIDATGITFHATYQSNPFLRTGYHYRIRDTHVGIDGKTEEQIDIAEAKKRAGKANDEDLGLIKLGHQAHHAGIVSAVGTTLYYDSTDSPTCPTRGLKSRLSAEIAGVGGYHSFFGLAYGNSYYTPLCDKTVMKCRLDVRFIVPYGKSNRANIPLDERLYLGGDTTIRGYKAWRLGPQFIKHGSDPSGGVFAPVLFRGSEPQAFQSLGRICIC